MEDWDLQAVVRGCTSEAFANATYNPSPPLPAPLALDQEDDLLSGFPGIFQPSAGDFDGLEGIYKLFCPGLHQMPPLSPQSFQSTTTSVSVPSEADNNKLSPELQKLPEKQPVSEVSSGARFSDVSRAAKLKRSRKNDQKRLVQQVRADGLSSDMWAWRKYGQKPIKGSPYPRSYYRCSTLKGCLARKQVERSSSDPSMFIVTYTAEHSHAHPPRRNALAGSTRVKSSTAKDVTVNEPKLPTRSKDECSPTTPSMASINTNDYDFVQLMTTRNEEEEQDLEAHGSSQMLIPESIFDDVLNPSLEDFEGLLFDQFGDTIPQMV